MKIQRRQPSLQTFAYNKGCTRHKYLEMYLFIVHCKLIKNNFKNQEKKLGVVELTASYKHISNYKNVNKKNTKFIG